MKVLIALLLFGLLSACSTAPSTSKRDLSTADHISLQRWGCYGKCPVYRVVIFADGMVLYEGRMFVKTVGMREKKIDVGAVASLRDKMEEVGFWTYKEVYPSTWQTAEPDGTVSTHTVYDSPSQIIEVVANGRSKKVTMEHGAPTGWQELTTLIDRVAQVHEWTGD